jgi:hypothetical protein
MKGSRLFGGAWVVKSTKSSGSVVANAGGGFFVLRAETPATLQRELERNWQEGIVMAGE